MISGKNIKIKELLFVVIVSVLLLLICTKSSPLYPMNDWTDVNCIYTMGKAINNGSVIYRDVFDHKGPVLYGVFAIADLISSNSHIGLWFFEIVCIAGFLYFTIQSSKLLVKNHNTIYFLIPFIALFLLTSTAFTHGGSTEELALFPLSYSLYYFIRLSMASKIHITEHILNGVCFALVFWMKFTMVALYLGVYFFVAIYVLFKKEKRLIVPTLYSVLGFFVVTAVILVYFMANNALKDLWEVYFYGNIFVYSDNAEFSERIEVIVLRLLILPLINFLFFMPIWVGFIISLFKKKKNMLPCFFTFCITMCSLYMAGARKYYLIVVAVYSCISIWGLNEIYEKLKPKKALLWIVGALFYIICTYTVAGEFKIFPIIAGGVFLAVMWILYFAPSKNKENDIEERKQKVSKALSSCFISANLILSFLMSFPMGNNTYMLEYEKEDLPQYRFAEIINAEENATLLNYGFLDGGFYFASGVMPINKYFYRSNLVTQELLDEQDYMIENHMVDFVVTRVDSPNQKVLDAGYVCVARCTYVYLNQDVEFYLFRLP